MAEGVFLGLAGEDWRALGLSVQVAGLAVLLSLPAGVALGLGEFGATLLFAGNQEATRTLAIQIFNLSNLPGDAYERRMWGLVGASVAVAAAALAAGEYLERRGRRRESA